LLHGKLVEIPADLLGTGLWDTLSVAFNIYYPPNAQHVGHIATKIAGIEMSSAKTHKKSENRSRKIEETQKAKRAFQK